MEKSYLLIFLKVLWLEQLKVAYYLKFKGKSYKL
jgi:hypothetical protein